MDTIPSQTQPTQTIPPPRTMHWMHEIRQYGAAFIAGALPVFTFLSLYIFYRRGYYDLYIANKAFAGTAAVLLGIILLIGPLSRYFAFPDRYIQYRKELGIIAFFLALIHANVSLFFLPTHFPLFIYFGTFSWQFVLGMIATVALFALFVISNERAAETIGRKLWWRMQNWGIRITFTLVLFHVFLMKWAGWVKWYKVGGGKELVHPELPGGGLLVGWFMAFVVFVRLAEFLGPRFFRAAWYVGIVTLPAIYIATFWWGMQFAK